MAGVLEYQYQCCSNPCLRRFRSRVQIPAGPLSLNIGQLSLASLWGREIEYLLRLRVKAGFIPLPDGR